MAGNIETAKDLGQGVYTQSENDNLLNAKADKATTLAGYNIADAYTETEVNTLLNAKQNTLVSGSNIKTIQGTSLLGSGNIQIEGVPSGVITMWSGSVSSIPAGWYLCNGSNGTPDLRNRFVYGASNDAEVKTTGGSANAVVVSHSHTVSGTTNTTGNHRHRSRAHRDYGGAGYVSDSGGADNSSVYTDYTGNHSHTVTGTAAQAGESGVNKNLPPYMKLAYIMKG